MTSTATSDGAEPKRPELSDGEFDRLRALIEGEFGIALGADKKPLVLARLGKIIATEGYASFDDYYRELVANRTHAMLSDLVDRISTNHTHFHREAAHFDFLVKTALPDVIEPHRARNQRDLRVWCAASSTGEEPYTLAMLVRDFLGTEYASWRAGVLATDISSRALDTARTGVYAADNVARLPEPLRRRYFAPVAKGLLQVDAQLRRDVVFRRFNLMNEKLPFKRGFDVIFCRNVMIYFRPETTRALVQRLYDATLPGGYLFVGHSEALDRSWSPFEFVAPGVHRKSSAVAAAPVARKG
ncbi:MAG: protein-glutamate O-methyltransferase CheR [Myxococcales bacterium]|nr:protein-glutamate O-methyltransferase CheR [Myxococcales bacterium]